MILICKLKCYLTEDKAYMHSIFIILSILTKVSLAPSTYWKFARSTSLPKIKINLNRTLNFLFYLYFHDVSAIMEMVKHRNILKCQTKTIDFIMLCWLKLMLLITYFISSQFYCLYQNTSNSIDYNNMKLNIDRM